MGLDDGLDPDERFDVGREAIGHEVELAVGRDEGDGPVVLEPREPHALVELDVLKLDRLAARHGPASRLEHELVVQPQLELGHAREEGLHLDRAHDLRVEDRSRAADQEVELLDDVEEDLVLPVLDPLRPPRDRVRHRHRRTGRRDVPVALLRDELAQDLRVHRLRVAKVHRLVHQLVDDHKVVPDALLVQLPKVVLEHPHQPVQVHQQQRHVRVPLRHAHQVQVVVLDVRERVPLVREDRPLVRLVLLLDVRRELL
mmetsp:Transcript_21420/g.67249  ORF Transcript_21420/g.67249 Transcript_21420/m.67249 type:complete len:257 (+) Transcript_21420:1433-2203(+)